MKGDRELLRIATLVLLASSLQGQCTGKLDQRTSNTAGVLVKDAKISGTSTLSSTQLNNLTSKLVGFCFNEDSEELSERVRELFQNRGYFKVTVQGLRLKVLDPLGTPKPVILETEVIEGPRFRAGEINFIGNRAFKSAQLRAVFPIKKGELFERSRVATGLEALRKAYSAVGYIDFVSVPDTEFLSDNTINLTIQANEGPQYRMGKVEIFANKELEEKLRAQWDLAEGSIFDLSYVDKYFNSHRRLFPSGFQIEHIQHVRNCRDSTVDIRMPVDGTDPRSQLPVTESGCEAPSDPESGSPKG